MWRNQWRQSRWECNVSGIVYLLLFYESAVSLVHRSLSGGASLLRIDVYAFIISFMGSAQLLLAVLFDGSSWDFTIAALAGGPEKTAASVANTPFSELFAVFKVWKTSSALQVFGLSEQHIHLLPLPLQLQFKCFRISQYCTFIKAFVKSYTFCWKQELYLQWIIKAVFGL